MMLFRSEEAVRSWCSAQGRQPGAIVQLAQLAGLAAAWYGDRLHPDWRPRSPAASQALLDSAGLTGPFWQLA